MYLTTLQESTAPDPRGQLLSAVDPVNGLDPRTQNAIIRSGLGGAADSLTLEKSLPLGETTLQMMQPQQLASIWRKSPHLQGSWPLHQLWIKFLGLLIPLLFLRLYSFLHPAYFSTEL